MSTSSTMSSGAHDPAARLYVTLGRLLREVRRSSGSAPIGPSAMGVLFTLSSADGGLRLGELAEAEGLSAPSLTRIVHTLVDLDLVERRPDPDDGRAQLVVLTEAGREIIGSGTQTRIAVMRRRYEALDDDQRASLLAALPALEALTQTEPALSS